MCAAIFDCAHRLFGLRFRLRPEVDTYHPDVKVYEVFEELDGGEEKFVGLFLHGESVSGLVGVACLARRLACDQILV